jgi:two-component system, cell cycle sensor histidine kinase and response regulator CckA
MKPKVNLLRRLVGNRAVRIVLLYATVSTTWIFFSDVLVESLGVTAEVITRYQTFKGLLFVATTSGMLLLLILWSEAMLRGSEDKYRRLVDNLAGSFMYRHNTEGTFTYVSQSITQVLGYSQEEFLKHFTEYLTDDPINQQGRRQTELSLKGVCQPPYEVQIRHKNGAIHWLDIAETPVLDDTGQVIAVEGIAHDITDRKQTEQALRDSEKRLRATFNQTFELMGYLSPDGIVLAINDTALKFAGIDESDVIGKLFWDTPWWAHSSEFRAQLKDAIAQAADGRFERYETTHPDANGDIRTIDFSIKPVIDVDGSVICLIPEGRDITERKRDEDARKRYEFIANASEDFMTLINGEYVYEAANDAYCHAQGRDRAQIIGASVVEVWGQDRFANAIKSRVDRAFAGETVNYREWFEFPALGRRCFDVAFSPFRGQGDQVTHVAVVSRDITDQERVEEEKATLQEQLLHAQKLEAVGQLSAGVAHDFNNLLTVIFGNTDMLRMSVSDNWPFHEFLDMIREAAEQASGVTKSLLTFSRKIPAEKQRIDLCETIEKSMRMLGRMLPASVEVVVDVPSGSPIWVSADATQIQQVVMNLAVNARDAMPDGGLLRISVASAGRQDFGELGKPIASTATFAQLTVSDTGAGIPEENLSQLFEPFFTTKPRGQGTGLGLSIIHGIVADHGGRIHVDSEVGEGTTLKVVLPSLGEIPTGADKAQRTELQRGHGETILLAEDNLHVSSVIVVALKAFNYNVIEARDGSELIEIAQQQDQEIRLLIVDVDMPKRSGLDCISDIRAGGNGIPAIIITGSSDPELENQLDDQTTLLRKPFDISTLGRAVAGIFDSPLGTEG